jgi:CheY-like chemotaxis protein
MTAGLAAILLVEDDPDDAYLVERAIRRAGIVNPVLLAADGDLAIRALDTAGITATAPGPIGLVLLDLKMPRCSGFEVLAWLRERPVLARIPVVVLTSSREPLDIDRAYDLGANSYLVKPGTAEDLLALVAQLGAYWLVVNQSSESVR